ncbi:hypothetical protein GMMP15_20004 [Candidatus Magnetomoraceae bacterium gMMP-15]
MKDIIDKFSSIIEKYDVIAWDSELTSYRFKAKILFINDSQLTIKDYVFTSKIRKYAYHWQDKNNNLIIRWDNARHWKNIETFPHHKHKNDGFLPPKRLLWKTF